MRAILIVALLAQYCVVPDQELRANCDCDLALNGTQSDDPQSAESEAFPTVSSGDQQQLSPYSKTADGRELIDVLVRKSPMLTKVHLPPERGDTLSYAAHDRLLEAPVGAALIAEHVRLQV